MKKYSATVLVLGFIIAGSALFAAYSFGRQQASVISAIKPLNQQDTAPAVSKLASQCVDRFNNCKNTAGQHHSECVHGVNWDGTHVAHPLTDQECQDIYNRAVYQCALDVMQCLFPPTRGIDNHSN